MIRFAIVLLFVLTPSVWASATATVCMSQSPEYVRAIVFPNGIFAMQALPILNAVSEGEYRSSEGNKLTIQKDRSFVLEVKREYKIMSNGTEIKDYSKFLSERFGQDFQCYIGDAVVN